MANMKTIMEGFRNFETIVEEEESKFPKYRNTETGEEWLDRGGVFTLCSERSCRSMQDTPENRAKHKLKCVANCPEIKAEPLGEQFGNPGGGTMPNLRFDQMHAVMTKLMSKKEFSIQALALLGNIYGNSQFPGHLGIEIPDKNTLIHRFKKGTKPALLNKAVSFIQSGSENESMFVKYLKKHGIDIIAGFSRDMSSPSVFVKAKKVENQQEPVPAPVAPGLPAAR